MSCSESHPHLLPFFEFFWSQSSPIKTALQNIYQHFEPNIQQAWGPEITNNHPHNFLEALSASPSNPNTNHNGSIARNYKPQKKFSLFQFHRNKGDILSQQGPSAKCLQIALLENSAGHWMTVFPHSYNRPSSGLTSSFLNAEEFRLAYWRRFDIIDNLFGALLTMGPVTCGDCGSQLHESSSIHLSDCVKKSGGKIWRHSSELASWQ